MKTFIKLIISTFVMFVAVLGFVMQSAYADTLDFDKFCSDKADGNYPHPTECSHYIACVGQIEGYEMVCATGNDGNPLHYVASSGPDPVTSRCDYPEKAGCEIAPSTSFFNNPFQSTVVSSIPTIGTWGARCNL